MSSAKILKVSLLLFLLFFPKGGFKFHGLPITWGYCLLAFAGFTCALKRPRSPLSPNSLALFLSLAPFWLAMLMTFTLHGNEHIPYTIALALGFVFLPALFLLTDLTTYLSRDELGRWIKRALLFIASYGIFLFCFKLITGRFIEIPYLTMNAADTGLLHLKSIQRGDFFKLISTYNNGNIYGVCVLMLLPFLPPHRYSTLTQGIVKLSLLLTLSRTVWLGWLFYECLTLLKKGKPLRILWVGAILLSIIALVPLLGFSQSFLWDATLGGRARQFELFQNLTLFGSGPFEEIKECVPLGLLESFGLFGLMTFLIPIGVALFFVKGTQAEISVLTYLFVSCSDGALLFIPTLAIFWGLISFTLSTSETESLMRQRLK